MPMQKRVTMSPRAKHVRISGSAARSGRIPALADGWWHGRAPLCGHDPPMASAHSHAKARGHATPSY